MTTIKSKIILTRVYGSLRQVIVTYLVSDHGKVRFLRMQVL